MLTPIEIQNKSFKSGGLGYDKRDVDEFMREVADSYEEIFRQRGELVEKVEELTEALSHYKTIEKTMQKALILAEKTSEETKKAALENARNIENEASVKAEKVLGAARNELDRINAQIVVMTQKFDAYKIELKNLANAQIELLNTDSFNLVGKTFDSAELNIDFQHIKDTADAVNASDELKFINKD